MTPQLHTRTAVTAALALAIAAALATGPPAHAEPADLRSPDAAGSQTATAPAGQDLRSPDGRERPVHRSSLAGTLSAKPSEDARSPDARDGGRKRSAPVPGLPTWPVKPVPITPATPRVAVAQVTPDAFRWGDAAIGAGGALGLVLLLAGGTAVISRRHRAGAGPLATS